jgi:hypothetical protein
MFPFQDWDIAVVCSKSGWILRGGELSKKKIGGRPIGSTQTNVVRLPYYRSPTRIDYIIRVITFIITLIKFY